MKRYALYYAPPAGALAEAAARWLGRDALTGAEFAQPHPDLFGLSVSARRYGFHATLKAPFRLAEGQSAEDLVEAVSVFAAGLSAFAIDGLEVAEMVDFLALRPVGDTAALDAFAAQVVARFERFRAPMSAEDRARRRPELMTERQRTLLDSYGYPYVMEEFRFHMTLSDRLSSAQMAELRPLAEAHFAPVLERPFAIGGIAVFGEDQDGVFHQLHRATLG
ncbi:DUF1045 domain-containing protein [Cereibacter sphaeroides]|nr:DUF1045 domain-containing protein [Cereibacter sphaeroides]